MANVKSILLFALLSIFAAMAFAINNANTKADMHATTVELMQVELAVKETEITQLAYTVEQTESEKRQLLKERETIANIQIKHESMLINIQNEYETALELIANLKANENETISNWAAVRIPFDTGSMLRYARACNQDSNGNQASISNATGSIPCGMQSNAIF